jgi:hypothetical protein
MRNYTRIAAVVTLIFLFGCAGRNNPLVGSWELIYPATEFPDSTARPVKVLTDSHFAFGSVDDEGRVFSGGGRYEFTDSSYVEYVRYHFLPILIGEELKFKCVISEDRWYHTGDFDIKGTKFSINEVWRRIEE